MDKLFKFCSLALCFVMIFVLSACSGEGTTATSTTPAATKGVAFSFNNSGLVSKSAGKALAAIVPTTIDPTATFASITVADASGNSVNYKVDIYSLNGSYVTATIPLAPGSYSVTEFLVLDSNNHVLYVAPTQTAADDVKALVSTVLPMPFGVTTDEANTVTLQVLAPDNEEFLQFGYPSVSFSVVNYIRFMSTVQIANSNSWQLAEADLTVNGVIYNHPAGTSTLRVAQAETYTLVFSKTGYDTKILTLSAADIARYQTTPLIVTLNPSYYDIIFDSNGGNPVPAQRVIYLGTVTRPEDPSRAGFDFVGWYSDAGLTTPFSFSTPITSNTTIYAKWAAVPSAENFYEYRFDDNMQTGLFGEDVFNELPGVALSITRGPNGAWYKSYSKAFNTRADTATMDMGSWLQTPRAIKIYQDGNLVYAGTVVGEAQRVNFNVTQANNSLLEVFAQVTYYDYGEDEEGEPDNGYDNRVSYKYARIPIQ